MGNVHRKTEFIVSLNRPANSGEPTVIAANHQTMLDPPVVFSCLSLPDLWRMSPVKFMTWHKHYNSFYKLPLYTTGCYPSHGNGLVGTQAAIHYANNGYRSFVFPEGKRIKNGNRTKPYNGISTILRELDSPRLILARIKWEKRQKFFSRPKLYVHMFEAPASLEPLQLDIIMDAIYNG
jgi:1-acyl-sn-glycerol-3-phosphate acyltransferase